MKKNLRRISVLITAQTANNLDRLAAMCGLRDQGRVIDKLVREKMLDLLEIGGVHYFIADILLRMLTPRELYNAMGFPPDYIIDRDYLGNEYGKAKQVARCGNAVCPPMATALVRANLPEWCTQRFETMEQFEKAVTA